MKKIHVGFLMSYDYDKLKKSIPPVYKKADRIFIAMDQELRTWSGENFDVDPSFFEWLKIMDTDTKIEIYKDDFYLAEFKAMDNEIREREMLSKKMGIGNWLIQVDCDEYFFNFENFVKDLRRYDRYLNAPEKNHIQIAAYLVNLYKYSDAGILYVKEPTRGVMATNFPNYKVGRNTRKRIVYTQNLLLHESIARTEEELLLKFENWGHNIDIKDKDAFMEKWRTTNTSNYTQREDFFYIEPEKWKHLDYAKGETLEDIANNMDLKAIMPSKTFIAGKNFGQWFKFLFK